MPKHCVYCGEKASSTKNFEGVNIPVCSGNHWEKYRDEEELSESKKSQLVSSLKDVSRVLATDSVMIFTAVLVAALILSEKYLFALAVFLVTPIYEVAWKIGIEKYMKYRKE